jgi:hypothetical protein
MFERVLTCLRECSTMTEATVGRWRIAFAAVASIAALLLTVLAMPAAPVRAATITVDTVDDDPTASLSSLRSAITSINNASDANAGIAANRVGPYGSNDEIDFAIPDAGVQTISLATALPTINQPMFINGYSQSGAQANTLATGTAAMC